MHIDLQIQSLKLELQGMNSLEYLLSFTNCLATMKDVNKKVLISFVIFKCHNEVFYSMHADA